MTRAVIVDDAIDLGRLLQAALNMALPGMPTVVVPSAEEAMLEATRDPPIDLLVTDIRLPGMTGLELVQKIRKRIPRLKVIMITGMTDDTLFDQAKELNVDEFLFKPMDISEFIDAARRCLGADIVAEIQPAVQEKSTPTSKGFGEVLTQLRQELSARCVLLLDDRGRFLAQSGELPDINFANEWISPIMAALNASARVARLVNKTSPKSALIFRNEAYHLILAPVGEFALILTLDATVALSRLEDALVKTLNAQTELGEMFRDRGVHVSAAEKVAPGEKADEPPVIADSISEPFEAPESTAALEHLLQNAGHIKSQDAEDFWSSFNNAVDIEPTNPDVLTYEQAKKLGLAPGA